MGSIERKFGTIKGVFIPNVLQMIGVILFLRLGYVLGHAGFMQMSVIITLSASLLFITGLSLGSIVSNMRMKGGGAYYLISRALGIEFGSAVGILGCTAQLCSIALCTSGFAISLQEFFPEASLPLLKIATLSSLVLVSYFSTDFALKAQVFIFFALITSISAIFWGSGPLPETLVPNEEVASLGFWGCFALFFPAMTGIESGMSMSGDLKNPSKALPLGTFGAVAVVYAIYMSITYFLSSFVPLDILRSHPFILYYTSKVGYLIVIGIWSATLSSALGALLGGPRVMQAVAKDGILPRFLSKGYGPSDQPRIATLFVFALAMVLTLGIDIDQIIPMLTMACLVSYSLINFIAFFESFMQNPSYRPTLKTHWFLSLLGSLSCLVAMFMINPGSAFLVIALVLLFCTFTAKRKIKGNWDDLKHGILSFFVHKGTIRLSNLEASAKSWRPHILTIFQTPAVHKNLAFFSHAINQGKGFLTFGINVLSREESKKIEQGLNEDLKGYKIPSHLHLNVCSHPYLGNSQIIRNYGFGLLKPNTVILSYPEKGEITPLIELLWDAYFQGKNVVVLKDDSLKDYLFTDSTRKDKKINLWWRGKHRGNFELCLALAYLLQQSKLWPRSKISIKMIAKDAQTKEKLLEQFNRYQAELRMKNLEFIPIIDAEENFLLNFTSNSEKADLTFLGLKKPEESESMDSYEKYFFDLVEGTKDAGNIAFVLSGEKIEFRNIFRDEYTMSST